MKFIASILLVLTFVSCIQTTDSKTEDSKTEEAPFTVGFSKEMHKIIAHFTDKYETQAFVEDSEHPLLLQYGRMQFDMLNIVDDEVALGERLMLTVSKFRDSTNCSKEFKDWIKSHTIKDGIMTFNEEFDDFYPDKVFLVKTDDQLIMLYGNCNGDDLSWKNFIDKLFRGIKGIRNTIEFTCDHSMLEKAYCCL